VGVLHAAWECDSDNDLQSYQFDMEWDDSEAQAATDKDVIAIFVDKFLNVSEVSYFTEKVVSYMVSHLIT
jgi:hypothetical protein